jgi:hypothetical protein
MKELSRYESWYGRDEAPPARTQLRAGPLTVMLDGGNLRWLRSDGVEITRFVGVSVRDVNWNTIPGEISDLVVDARQDSFLVEYVARHRAPGLDFGWRARLEGTADGTITFAMDGTANEAFRYCRIGIEMLHPLEGHRSAKYVARGPAGVSAGLVPPLVAPELFEEGFWRPVFGPYTELRLALTSGGTVRFAFDGELWELEDQRNWTDASLKSFCMPLERGFPLDAAAGETFRQQVRIAYDPPADAGVSTRGPVEHRREPASLVDVDVERPAGLLPTIGVSLGEDPDLDERSIALLRALRLDHLRVDLALDTPADRWRAVLQRGAEASAKLGTGLEIAVVIGDDAPAALAALADAVAGMPVTRFLLIRAEDVGGGASSGELAALGRAHLAAVTPGAALAVGAAADFMALNRVRPRTSGADAVYFPVCPQIHASDEASIMETITVQADAVGTARSFVGDLPVVVSPITLKPPFNAYATEDEQGSPQEGPPPTVDPRQPTLFAAAWLTGSLGALAEAGVSSTTWFEAIGPRGILEGPAGSPWPAAYRSLPGMVSPTYHVLRWLAALKSAPVLSLRSADPSRVRGVAVRSGAGLRRVLLANLTPESVAARVRLPAGRPLVARVLDEATFRLATLDPDRYVATAACPLPDDAGGARLELAPYATVAIDEA